MLTIIWKHDSGILCHSLVFLKLQGPGSSPVSHSGRDSLLAGMLLKVDDHLPTVHLPCWKCYGHKPFDREDVRWSCGDWVFHEGSPVYCFALSQTIVPASQGSDLECPLHGKIRIMHTAPDLVQCIVCT